MMQADLTVPVVALGRLSLGGARRAYPAFSTRADGSRALRLNGTNVRLNGMLRAFLGLR
jgi:hypothetical protein